MKALPDRIVDAALRTHVSGGVRALLNLFSILLLSLDTDLLLLLTGTDLLLLLDLFL